MQHSPTKDKIKCVLLPLVKQRFLVLPEAFLAEVVDSSRNLLVMGGARDGLIGKVQWRGHSVPLVSFEAAMGDMMPGYNTNTRIAVLFSLNGDSALPYMAFTVQGEATFTSVLESDLVVAKGQTHALVAHWVKIKHKLAIIPDMLSMESFFKLRIN